MKDEIIPISCIAAIVVTVVSIVTSILYFDSKVDIEAIKAGLHQTMVGNSKIWTKEGCR